VLQLDLRHMDFISILSIFVLACFVGYFVVWSVTPALHTPLMAVTNAISSVIIVGALIAPRRREAPAPSGWGLLGGGAGQHQHLRRLRGHRANARHVQEEGAALMHEAPHARRPGCARLSDRRHLLHPRAARPVEPGKQPRAATASA
jgi:hypothetical protein